MPFFSRTTLSVLVMFSQLAPGCLLLHSRWISGLDSDDFSRFPTTRNQEGNIKDHLSKSKSDGDGLIDNRC